MKVRVLKTAAGPELVIAEGQVLVDPPEELLRRLVYEVLEPIQVRDRAPGAAARTPVAVVKAPIAKASASPPPPAKKADKGRK